MGRALAAVRAELHLLQTLRHSLLVTGRRVVSALALRAGQYREFSHRYSSVFLGVSPAGHFRPGISQDFSSVLLDDARNRAGADRAAAFADGEAHLVLKRDRRDELDGDLDVVAGHDHLDALGELDVARHVRRADVLLEIFSVKNMTVFSDISIFYPK